MAGADRPARERRRYPRAPVVVEVCGSSYEDYFELGQTRDISAGGMFIEISRASDERVQRLATMNDLQVLFRLPGALQPLEVVARVVRIERSETDQSVTGLALEFAELPQSARTAVETVVQATQGRSRS